MPSVLISSKSEYGLRALMDIAINGNGQPVGRSGIAERQQIPLPYLTQVLGTLVNGGLLISTRGPSGGYILSQPPDQISLLDVITLLQGPVSPTNCAAIKESRECNRFEGCGLVDVWSRLQSASEDVLRETTISDIITRGDDEPAAAGAGVVPDEKLDCIGVPCPLPIMRMSQEIRHLKSGQILEVWADDEGSKADIPAWCMGTGNEFLGREEFGEQMKFLIRKGTD
jgi:Rrf2 family protein